MTMAEHDGNVFCKQCYSRKFGIRGVGFGVGAGALAMDTGDRFGNTESLSYVSNFSLPSRYGDRCHLCLETNPIMPYHLVPQEVLEVLQLQTNKPLPFSSKKFSTRKNIWNKKSSLLDLFF